MNPYIGITDFTSFAQVQQMLNVFKTFLLSDSRRMLHVGVVWQNVSPRKENIANIFSSQETYNCLHYADCANQPCLGESIVEAVHWCGKYIHAIQLDMTWPDPAEIIDGINASRKKVEVILQIGKGSLAQASNDPREVVKRLEDYRNIVNRVLLDESVGRGLCMDVSRLTQFVLEIRKNFPTLGIGVCGGLGPDTVHIIAPLARLVPEISIDADVDWNMAEEYLTSALRLLF